MKEKRTEENVVLIGFMGSGKTTIGLRLSYSLKRAIEDTDKLIEKKEGRSIKDIFADDGEEYFRGCETDLLKELCETQRNKIISVGGGTPVRAVNRPLLKQLGIVVYLRIRPETVYERLRYDETRPLLMGQDPLEKICALMTERSAAYEEAADYIIDVDELKMEEVVAKIKSYVEKRNKKPGKLLVINGPNLNFLGIREKSVYGTQDYNYLLELIRQKGVETGQKITVFQSNHEGAIIDRIQEAYFDGTEGIVINPGAYTHYSYAIRDALASIVAPKVEVHISDITQREEFRRISVTAPVCDKQIYGQGLDGYLQAIDFINDYARDKTTVAGK